MDVEDLSETERALWDAFPRAESVDLRGRGQVRADVIAALLLGARPAQEWRVPAVRLTGARVTGVLDLSFAEVRHAASLRDCVFEEPVDLYGARTRQLNLAGSRLPGLRATEADIDGLLWLQDCRFDGRLDLADSRIDGALSLRSARLAGMLHADALTVCRRLDATGLHVSGEVLLRGARVEGVLTLDHAHLANAGAVALNGDGIVLNDGLFCHDLHVDGEVRLPDARIRRQLVMSGARLSNRDGRALYADRMRVEGAATFNAGFHAEGQVRLEAAQVQGPADFSGSWISDPGGVALRASRAQISGGLFCRDGFRVDGEVELVDAAVGASAEFGGARLSSPGGRALTARGMSVGTLLDYSGGFRAEGSLILTGARVGTLLRFDDAAVSAPGEVALGCREVRAAVLRLTARTSVEGTIDLRHTRVEVLRDDAAPWSAHSMLDGFTYQTIETPGTVDARLAWLDGAEGYHPQPYEQLATAYRAMGRDAEARTVQLERQRRRRRTLPLVLRIWGVVQDWTVGYGYRPLRAALWLTGLLVAGTVVFGAHHPPPAHRGEGPGFSPILYALDLLLPIIDYGQQGAFDPRGGYRWLAALLITAGWVLATTIAAGVTRVLSRQ